MILIVQLCRRTKEKFRALIKQTLLLLFLSWFIASNLFSQKGCNADSLERQLTRVATDTGKVSVLVNLGECLMFRNFKAGEKYINQALALVQAIRNKNSGMIPAANLLVQQSRAHTCKGVIFSVQGNFDSALRHFENSLVIRKQLKDKKGIADCLGDISEVSRKKGNYPLAIQQGLEALKIREEIHDERGISISYNNLAVVFRLKKDLSTAMEYMMKGIAIKEKMMKENETVKTIDNLAYSLNNLSNIYRDLNRTKEAISALERAIELYRKSGNQQGLGSAYSNLGVMLEESGQGKKALSCYLKSIEIKERVGSKEDITTSYINLGAYYSSFNPKEAEKYLMKGFLLARETGYLEYEKEGALALSQFYEGEGNTGKAFFYHKEYSRLKDSVLNEERHQQITEMQTKYESEKKDKENALLKQKNAIQALEAGKRNEEIRAQRIIIVAVGMGLLIMVLLAFFIFRGYREKKRANEIIFRQKAEVESQKHLVEEKQKEILDSIYYARRIQRSLLPNEKYIRKHLKRLNQTNGIF